MNGIVKSQNEIAAWNGEPLRSTPEEVLQILLPMFALFPQMKMEESSMAFYVHLLQDIAPETLARAVHRAMAECKFLPTVADIRERAQADSLDPDPDPCGRPSDEYLDMLARRALAEWRQGRRLYPTNRRLA